MSRISGLGTILERLRLRGTSAAGERPGKRSDSAAPAARASGTSLEQTLASRLSRLDQTRPGAEQEAIAIFIETVLAHEFGEALLEQSSGRELLSQVQDAMLSAPEVRAALLSLLGGLARPGPG